MKLVKLGLAEMTAAEQAEFALRVGDALIHNEPTFADPPMAGADLQDLAILVQTALVDADSLRAQLRTATAEQADLEAQLRLAVSQIGNYVQNVSGGDAKIIGLAGMDFRRTPAPVGELPSPSDLQVSVGANPGEMSLRWTPVSGAKTYRIERTTDLSSPDAWTSAGFSTKAKATVNGMTSGTRYWFRVAAVGTAGQGAWSEEIGKIVW